MGDFNQEGRRRLNRLQNERPTKTYGDLVAENKRLSDELNSLRQVADRTAFDLEDISSNIGRYSHYHQVRLRAISNNLKEKSNASR